MHIPAILPDVQSGAGRSLRSSNVRPPQDRIRNHRCSPFPVVDVSVVGRGPYFLPIRPAMPGPASPSTSRTKAFRTSVRGHSPVAIPATGSPCLNLLLCPVVESFRPTTIRGCFPGFRRQWRFSAGAFALRRRVAREHTPAAPRVAKHCFELRITWGPSLRDLRVYLCSVLRARRDELFDVEGAEHSRRQILTGRSFLCAQVPGSCED